jgi:hypothetical protein
MRRADFVGVNIRRLDLKIRHDNSSTIKAGYMEKNAQTYFRNEKHYQSKIESNDYTAGGWSLEIRRANGWE